MFLMFMVGRDGGGRNLCWFVVALLIGGGMFGWAESPSLEAYKQGRNPQSAQELYSHSLEAVRAGGDESVLRSALGDLIETALSKDRAEAALEAADALLGSTFLSKDAANDATLARAVFFARLGERDEAYAAFRTALNERWNPQCAEMFLDALWENADDALAAVEEYQLVSTDVYGDGAAEFFNKPDDLSRMLYYIHAFKVANPHDSALEAVYASLPVTDGRPNAKTLARCFCLAEDGRFEEAFEALAKLENDCPKDDGDWKELPLYRASLLFLQGKDYEAARAAFAEFDERNSDEPSRVLDAAARLCETMGVLPKNKRNVEELTKALIREEWLSDEALDFKPGDAERYAAILHHHQLSLGWQGRQEEARELTERIKELYYPHTKGGRYAMLGLGVYLLKVSFKQAELLWLDLLDKAGEDSELILSVKCCLGDIKWRATENWTALNYLQDVLDRIGEHPQGEHKRVLGRASYQKNDILNPPAIKKLHPEMFRLRPIKK